MIELKKEQSLEKELNNLRICAIESLRDMREASNNRERIHFLDCSRDLIEVRKKCLLLTGEFLPDKIEEKYTVITDDYINS